MSWTTRTLGRLLGRLPTSWWGEVGLEALLTCARRVEPREGLRMLFDVDQRVYLVEGRLAKAYEGGVHAKHRLTRYHDFFLDRIHSGQRVLDIGCGIGALAYDIAQRCDARVTGIEIDASNLAEASRRYSHERVRYVEGDVTRELPEGGFDVIVLSNVLEHLRDRPALLRHIVTATGAGQVLIRVPSFERDWRIPLRREIGVDWRLDDTHETEYTLESMREELDRADLDVVEIQSRWGELWVQAHPRSGGGGPSTGKGS
mgnify:CR=1 FL=1